MNRTGFAVVADTPHDGLADAHAMATPHPDIPEDCPMAAAAGAQRAFERQNDPPGPLGSGRSE